jgi:hypothetical protein
MIPQKGDSLPFVSSKGHYPAGALTMIKVLHLLPKQRQEGALSKAMACLQQRRSCQPAILPFNGTSCQNSLIEGQKKVIVLTKEPGEK